MDERGLTAFIVTIHTPAMTVALAMALFTAAVAMVVVRRPIATRAWIAALWFSGVVVGGYAGVTRLIDVPGFDAEKISILP
ncbi:MAG: hypothetical protein Q8O67_26490 [Deltaproteobacteria bacterium]|nr:hypothetical protein [Deltaproteobacteria bacterium]